MIQNRLELIYDEDCGFCQACVRFVRRHASSDTWKFVPRRFDSPGPDINQAGPANAYPDSLVVSDGYRKHYYSQAVFLVIRELRFPWNMLILFSLLPVAWTDAMYKWTARNRRLFSRHSKTGNSCDIPVNRKVFKVPTLPFRTFGTDQQGKPSSH